MSGQSDQTYMSVRAIFFRSSKESNEHIRNLKPLICFPVQLVVLVAQFFRCDAFF